MLYLLPALPSAAALPPLPLARRAAVREARGATPADRRGADNNAPARLPGLKLAPPRVPPPPLLRCPVAGGCRGEGEQEGEGDGGGGQTKGPPEASWRGQTGPWVGLKVRNLFLMYQVNSMLPRLPPPSTRFRGLHRPPAQGPHYTGKGYSRYCPAAHS